MFNRLTVLMPPPCLPQDRTKQGAHEPAYNPSSVASSLVNSPFGPERHVQDPGRSNASSPQSTLRQQEVTCPDTLTQPAMQNPLRDEPSRREEKPRTEHDEVGARVAQAWGDTDTTSSVTSSVSQDHHEHQPLSPQPHRPPADSSSTLSSTDGASPQVQEPAQPQPQPQQQQQQQQQQEQQQQRPRMSLARITSSAASSAAPAGPTKRESLRAFAPLLRRAESIKNAPWAIALQSTRARDKRLLEQGITRFNQKPAAGIELLISTGVLQRTPGEVAGFLRQHAGELSKKRIGEYVGSHDPFAHEVLHQLLQEYDFQGMAIDEAMRLFINDIRMPGEAQMLDRVLNAFARRFFEINRTQGGYATEDTVYILSFSIMLLNTDLHNRNLPQKEKMRLEDFVRNNRGINGGQDLPRELLTGLYHSIKRHEMRMKEGDMWESNSLTFMAPRISGWLEKKVQGQLGISRFHRFWFVLTNGCLFYFKGPADQDPRCIIILEAVMAIKGASSTEIILYSNGGGSGVIKSVKISKSDKTTTQGQHTRFVLRADTRQERDDWVEAFQTETEPFQRQHRLGSSTAYGGTTTVRSATTTNPTSSSSSSSNSSASKTGGLNQTIRSPRSAGGLQLPQAYSECLTEGWMRRRADASRAWQRRYFMLVMIEKTKHRPRHVELHWYTTLEMAQSQIGVRGCQGSVGLDDPTLVFHVKTTNDRLAYRLPEPTATVFEMETMVHGSKVKELISPEDEVSLGVWLEALRPFVTIRSSASNGRIGSGGATSSSPGRG